MAYETFYRYRDSIEDFLKITDDNFPEKVKMLPSIKHYWVAKLIEIKIELKKMKEAKEKFIKEQVGRSKELEMSSVSVRKVAESTDACKAITAKIEEYEIIVEYLTKADDILRFATNDLKNVIETKKLELL